ncbi:hypothetical protein ABMA32_10090 [Mesorhizobium sp. VNQ89]|uniref:hypothetical protein n=1 Tax=Mesorhizobium quangtriensis TaxID=3157709 RepID=UPI0032B73CCC
MFKEHRIVCVTPAGRRRYMRLLIPQILASAFVDRYDIWVNTTNASDIRFLEATAKLDSRINLVAQPDGAVDGTKSIGAFHRLSMDEDTVYVRFDDDVVWIEPGFFERFLAFRIAHPEYLLTMPLIINNAICTALLERTGRIRTSRPISMSAWDKIGWKDGRFAKSLHELFLKLAETGDWHRLKGGNYPISLARFSINCISWFGRDLAKHPQLIGWNEEEDWTTTSAIATGRTNCITGDAIVAHYAFYPQRYEVDASNLLDRYELLLAGQQDTAEILAKLDNAFPVSSDPETEGGSKVSAPGLLDRLQIWSRPWRGREAIVSLPQPQQEL